MKHLLGVLAGCSLLLPAAHAMQAVHGDPGLLETRLLTPLGEDVGAVDVWNTVQDFNLRVRPDDTYQIEKIRYYVGIDPLFQEDDPFQWGAVSELLTFATPPAENTITLNLQDDLGIRWGKPYEYLRYPYIALRVHLRDSFLGSSTVAWAMNPAYLPEDQFITPGGNGFQFMYEIQHPRRGHFIDSPVRGLGMRSPTHRGKTGDGGGFDYFPGEKVAFSIGDVPIGEALAAHKVSPLGIFPGAQTSDPQVINMARLLQSLDADGEAKKGIDLTDEVEASFGAAMDALSLDAIDFHNDLQVDAIIDGTITASQAYPDLNLVEVSAEDAKENLDRSLDSNMFRKNVSRTPEEETAKSKLALMPMWFPALRANGEPATYQEDDGTERPGVPYYDEDGVLIRVATEAKPIVIAYADADPETGAHDIWCAVSRDDGNTWKRKNLSRTGDRSSFELDDGTPVYGHCKKPVIQVQGNRIFIAWTGKYARGGKPRYAIDPLDGYPYDDPYYEEDIWGVAGPQRSHDYTEDGFPEVGVVPYSAVWCARGVIVTQGMINSSAFWAQCEVGDIVWFKPERLTSARRDAYQLFAGGASGAGFGIIWQEDPEGIRPGSAAGPGHGWSGATASHKSDIWYSYIGWDDFLKVDSHFLPGGDPEHDDVDFIQRPKILVPMSLPVRVSDNDVVNTDSMKVLLDEAGLPERDIDGNLISLMDEEGKHAGSHRYGYLHPGLYDPSIPDNVFVAGETVYDPSETYTLYEFVNEKGVTKRVVITRDGRLLDGDTGASRPNLILRPFTRPDGTKSAWALVCYEETKGVGGGAPDHEPGGGPYGDEYVADQGKNYIYHTFEFNKPDLVSAGHTMNRPESVPVFDAYGNDTGMREVLYLYAESETEPGMPGELMRDWRGEPLIAYKNCRRGRFIHQTKSAAGPSRTVFCTVYKEGEEGKGRPSDIMLSRCVFPPGDKGNPYRFANVVKDPSYYLRDPDTGELSAMAGVPFALNMSSVTPTMTWINPDRDENAKGDGIKVTEWVQMEENLYDDSEWNPYDDARAHRGQIRGDFVVIGYTWTPNWAASRNANDHYDFYVRRSFDGGVTWTTDPSGSGVTHIDEFKDYTDAETEDGKKPRYIIETFYPPGAFEAALNVSRIKNNKETVIEPRIVSTPGTIKNSATGLWTGIPEDKQDPAVYYMAFGTSLNLASPHGNDDDEEVVGESPLDVFFTFTRDFGESYHEDSWIVNGNPINGEYENGETKTGWFRLAKGDPEQGECQIRMTPDGSRFYASWNQNAEDESDCWMRRITDAAFPANALQMMGDLDYDSDIDFEDYFVLRSSYGAHRGEMHYNQDADLRADDVIDLYDVQIWMSCYRSYLFGQ